MKTIEQAAKEFAQSETMETYDSLIEELKRISFIHGANFAQQWISVEDELPENGSLCLSAPSASPLISEIELCWFKDGEFIMKTPTKNNNSFVGISRENLTATTTHWRPINLK